MTPKIKIYKNHASHWVLGIFLFTIITAAMWSEAFQTPTSETETYSEYRNLFPPDYFNTISELTIKNRLGELTLTKKEGHWRLTAPRNLLVKQAIPVRAIEVLKAIKIRKILPKDAINISNFSLDAPLLSISLKKDSSPAVELSLGLVDTIGNSTYVTLSDQEAIFHIDSPGTSFDNLELSSIVESSLFSFPLEELTYYELKKWQVKKPLLLIIKKRGVWIDHKKRELRIDKVQKHLEKMWRLHSTTILDQRTEKMNQKIDKYTDERPFYLLTVKSKKGELVSYKISTILSSLPDLRIEKGSHFVIKASNRIHPFLLDKKFFFLFGRAQKRFKPLHIKKLFY